jgi:hypothetical protein
MKFTLGTIFDISKALSTKSGAELADVLRYMSDFFRQTASIIDRGITLADNVNCELLTVEVSHETEQIINPKKRSGVVGIIPIRVISSSYSIGSFGWYVTDRGELAVKAGFAPTPTPTTLPLSIVICVFY